MAKSLYPKHPMIGKTRQSKNIEDIRMPKDDFRDKPKALKQKYASKKLATDKYFRPIAESGRSPLTDKTPVDKQDDVRTKYSSFVSNAIRSDQKSAVRGGLIMAKRRLDKAPNKLDRSKSSDSPKIHTVNAETIRYKAEKKKKKKKK